jgi:hypothetical protein
MSRRNFSQPSVADAFVNTYCRVGGFLEDVAKTFKLAAFGVLMEPTFTCVERQHRTTMRLGAQLAGHQSLNQSASSLPAKHMICK